MCRPPCRLFIASRIDRLRLAEFIYEQPAFPDIEYCFKHALTQEVAYNSVLVERRRLLHEHAAQSIEALFADRLEDHLTELAHHYDRSGNLPKAVEYLHRTGARAAQQVAHSEAIGYFTRALELLRRLPEGAGRDRQELDLQMALSWSLFVGKPNAPELESALIRARELGEQLGENAKLMEALLVMAWNHRRDFGLARELAERVLAMAEEAKAPAMLAGAHCVLGAVLAGSGQFPAAREHLERAVELFGAGPSFMCYKRREPGRGSHGWPANSTWLGTFVLWGGQTMKKQSSFYFCVTAALVIALSSAGPAAAQNTKLGTGALQNNTTGDQDTALGFDALFSNTMGGSNTATGYGALLRNKTGSGNTATGDGALFFNTGSDNTATGDLALEANTSGGNNTATGVDALEKNTTGHDNTATGLQALSNNGTGATNTATGVLALSNNSSGSDNTATGANALQANTMGIFNTATGALALHGNTTGNVNTADGLGSLFSNTTGGDNTSTGVAALFTNSTGADNTAMGANALDSNTSGSNNIGLGFNAGLNLTTGSNNIDVGNHGVAAESKTIRIGTQGTQTATFIAGISGAAVIGSDVAVTAKGQLGIVMSSARFKRDISDMGGTTNGLMKLRPVTFRYREDASGTRQYGLVAEEVERVYPELVTRGTDGKVETVRYSMLSAMLLNELQKLSVQMAQQKTSTERRIAELQANHDRELRAMQAAFRGRLSALEQTLQARDGNRKLAAAFDR